MEQLVINIIDTHNDFLTVEKYTGDNAPVLTYSGGENRFSPVMSSKFKFNILNETAQDGRYLDLLTGDERRFLIEIRKVIYLSAENDKDAGLVWRGFLLPDVYSEPYKNGAFMVEFTATDGLDVLKTKPFLFYKSSSCLDFICKCLWETGLDQEIYFAPSIENAFYDWKNIQIFEECFTKHNENTDVYEYSDCYSVLEKLMKAVGATVLQHKGKWFIVGYNRKGVVLDTFKVYDKFGKFVRNEQHIKSVKTPLFNDGLSVNMLPPYKTVQFDVSYKNSDKAIDLTKLIKNEELSEEAYFAQRQNLTTGNQSPFNKWRAKGATKVTAEPEDGATYLRLYVEGNNTMHDPNEYPEYYMKAPYCVTMFKVYGPPHDFARDYIELKPENTIYVSPQVEGKDLILDIEMELKIMSRANKQKYDSDFYRQAFRVDILIGDDVVFSTRSEEDVYKSDDTKITFEEANVGPKYYWYVFPDYTKPVHVLDRFNIPAALKAVVKRKALKTSAFGHLNVRVYIPRNADNAFGFDDFHVSQVTVTKLDVQVKAWDSEQHAVSREIRYTTKYQTDMAISDGKNDLYVNLFKINDRADYEMALNEQVLFSGAATTDALYYYYMIPGVYGDLVTTHYSTLKLYNGANWQYAHLLFGKLSTESGIEFLNGSIRISKSRIDEFPAMRLFLSGVTKITIGKDFVLPAGSLNGNVTVPREHYISWKRFGVNASERFLTAHAKLIHECSAVQGVALNGVALQVVSPLDVVQFNYMGLKYFIPTAVQINFSSGKTTLSLVQDVNQNITDYAES